MSNRWPGSIINQTPATPGGPFQDSRAPGVWTLADALYWTTQGQWPIASNPTPKGIFAGGGGSNIIDYITLSTTGNALDFGDLTRSVSRLGACSSFTRGVFAGGGQFGGTDSTNIIDYITMATTSNAIDFGDLINSRTGLTGFSSSTRGIFAGGRNSSTTLNPYQHRAEYITIASTGNAVDWGYLAGREDMASCASSTVGVVAGGFSSLSEGYEVTYMIYASIASLGTTVGSGQLTTGRRSHGACSSRTLGVFAGGTPTTNIIDYVTISTGGNAIDFGDLSVTRTQLAGCSSRTRGVFGGGGSQNVIDYVTFSTTGNAIDFGDLTAARWSLAACSGDHGGLQV